MRLWLSYFAFMSSVGLTNRTSDIWRSARVADDIVSAFRAVPLGDPARRGLVRAMALVAIQMWCVSIVIAVSPWFAADGESPAAFRGYLSMAAIVVLLVVVVIEATVILFNRPRNLVAPHMRGERGVLR
ncbi:MULTISPECIES: hypothetical protein [unclassified Embleya]|uniref:hypothetical protein n=1 Tax=unclassified Embleya TaxID=2699296 RepID=UPI0033E254C2